MGNVTQGLDATRKPQFALPFAAGSLSQATTGTLLASNVTGHNPRVMPTGGSVYGLAGSYSTALTAGTVSLWPVINGTVNQSLTVTNAAANAKGLYVFGDARKVNFNAGDTLQIIYKTAGLNAAGGALVVDCYIMFENVDL